MAKSRKKRTGRTPSGQSETSSTPDNQGQKPARSNGRRKRVSRKRRVRDTARTAKVRARVRSAGSPRRRFTPAERQRILATARRENLTGAQVAQRYGVAAVTYYLWRQKARPAIRTAARTVRESRLIDVADELRRQLRDQIRGIMPELIRSEVDAVMTDLSGTRRRRRRRR